MYLKNIYCLSYKILYLLLYLDEGNKIPLSHNFYTWYFLLRVSSPNQATIKPLTACFPQNSCDTLSKLQLLWSGPEPIQAMSLMCLMKRKQFGSRWCNRAAEHDDESLNRQLYSSTQIWIQIFSVNWIKLSWMCLNCFELPWFTWIQTD